MIVCDKDYLLIFDHHCIFRLANIQRSLLESGAEATAEGEQGGREELEVNLNMFSKENQLPVCVHNIQLE